MYETTKEGPSHEPSFRSTVIVNDIRYDSLLGFAHRKEAEQSAAEVALRELSKSSDAARCISQPVVSCFDLRLLHFIINNTECSSVISSEFLHSYYPSNATIVFSAL